MSSQKIGLLVVDMQKGFLDESHNDYVQKVQDFLDQNHARYDVIVATRFFNPKKSLWRMLLNWEGCDEHSSDLLLRVSLPQGSKDVDKSTYGISGAPQIQKWLKDVERVDVLGVDTDACVLLSCLELFDLQIKPYVLSDLCVSTRGDYYHHMALEILRRNIGQEQVCSSYTVWQDKP